MSKQGFHAMGLIGGLLLAGAAAAEVKVDLGYAHSTNQIGSMVIGSAYNGAVLGLSGSTAKGLYYDGSFLYAIGTTKTSDFNPLLAGASSSEGTLKGSWGQAKLGLGYRLWQDQAFSLTPLIRAQTNMMNNTYASAQINSDLDLAVYSLAVGARLEYSPVAEFTFAAEGAYAKALAGSLSGKTSIAGTSVAATADVELGGFFIMGIEVGYRPHTMYGAFLKWGRLQESLLSDSILSLSHSDLMIGASCFL